MINKSVKKYLLGIGQDETGAMLIVSFLIMVLLTIVGGAALTNSVIETKISANFKKSASAFYTADAGIEAGKGFILARNNIDDALDGVDNKVGPPPADDVDNGLVFTNQGISGGSYTVTVADDNDLDGAIWEDVNSVAVLTSTGTGQSNSSAKIEAYIRYTPFIFPGALTWVDNENGADDNDEVKVDISNWNNGQPSDGVMGMVITGLDTLDGSNIPGSGTGPDVEGFATQEGQFNTAPSTILQMTNAGVDEATQTMCDPPAGICYPTLSGDTGGSVLNATTGPTEAEMKTMFANFKAEAQVAPNYYLAGANNGPWPLNVGTAIAPVIAVIENGTGQTNFDTDLTGYGILIVEGRLRIQANIEWHGVIYISCRGGIELADNTADSLEVWGGVAMINYDDNDQANCGGGSDEERIEINQGLIHIYYSTEAIQTFAMPFGGLETIAWRELD